MSYAEISDLGGTFLMNLSLGPLGTAFVTCYNLQCL